MSDLRMPDLNKVMLAGRLTRDPELRYTSSNTPWCKLGLAVSRVYKTKDGEKREDTVFINATAWRATAEYCGNYLRKGRPVLVEGRLISNDWEDKQTGQKRSTIEVQIDRIQQLDWADREGAGSGAPGRTAPPERYDEPQEPPAEDDIPF